jgi:DNA-binding XRE family transcriptional regulator
MSDSSSDSSADERYHHSSELTDEQAQRFTVRELRERNNMRQIDLAVAARVAISSISEIERGRQSPTIQVALRIAHALHWPVEQIAWGVVAKD